MSMEDKALQNFLAMFDERKRKEELRHENETRIVTEKRALLTPIRIFLKGFEEIGLMVNHSDNGTPGVALQPAQKFKVYESESSPTWSPGISIFFDHPAKVEIAVFNENEREKMGVFSIQSVTASEDTRSFQQKFKTSDQVKDVLARYLAEAALSIEKDPRKQKAPQQPPSSKDFGQVAPDGPPDQN